MVNPTHRAMPFLKTSKPPNALLFVILWFFFVVVVIVFVVVVVVVFSHKINLLKHFLSLHLA